MEGEWWRAVQLRIRRAEHEIRLSGFVTGPGIVVTCAHDLDQEAPDTVEVVGFAPDGQRWSATAEAIPVWSMKADVALVRLPEGAGPQVAPIALGDLPVGGGEVPCCAVGFPRFKLRRGQDGRAEDDRPENGAGFRDSHVFSGVVEAGSGVRSGMPTIATAHPPAEDAEAERSRWEGMSGAGVTIGGRLFAVVVCHHPADGTGRLTVSPVALWITALTETERAVAGQLIGLPEAPEGLASAILGAEERAVAAQRAYITGHGFAAARLIGREAELECMAAFATASEGPEVLWWVAGPQTGKTALSAQFALEPPSGVRVVAFFISGRIGDQNRLEACLGYLAAQLQAITDEDEPAPGPWEREQRLPDLLVRARKRLAAQGMRLVLLIDGLDEAETTGARGIASFLGRLPQSPGGLIVTSRRHPTTGTAGTNPALHSAEQKELAPSPHAEVLPWHALEELRRMDDAHAALWRDILGMVTLTRGVTQGELAEVTGRPAEDFPSALRDPLARSLNVIRDDSRPEAELRWVLAHSSLQEQAESDPDLAPLLDRCAGQIIAWAERYQSRGWPEDTPMFLLEGYATFVSRRADNGARAAAHLLTLATDPNRHRRLFASTGSDWAALEEVDLAWEHFASLPEPDLGALVRCAIHRWRLHQRCKLPQELPAAWARLGHFRHAENLARSIHAAGGGVSAMLRVAEVAADFQRGRAERICSDAEQRAQGINNPGHRDRTLLEVAEAWAVLAPDRAERIAHEIKNSGIRAQALRTVAQRLADHDPERAAAIARGITPPYDSAKGVQAVATAVAVWSPGLAERLARGIKIPGVRAEALLMVAQASGTRHPDRAERIAHTIEFPTHRAQALRAVAEAVAARNPDRVEQLLITAEQAAQEIISPDARAEALKRVTAPFAPRDHAQVLREAESATVAHDRGEVERLLTEAEGSARDIRDRDGLDRARLAVAQAMAADAPHEAEQLARSIEDPKLRDQALASVAAALGPHAPQRAAQIAHSIKNLSARYKALKEVESAAAAYGSERSEERVPSVAARAEDLVVKLKDDEWWRAIPGIAGVDRGALTAAAEELWKV
jgi:hypothetical protein